MTEEDLKIISYYRMIIYDREDALKRFKKKLQNVLNTCDHCYPDKTDAIDYGTCKICKETNLYYQDKRFCGHCDEVTNHICRNSVDSSQDYQECLVCHWFSFDHKEYVSYS